MPADPHRFDDLFAEFGPIALRRFFGGEGIYAGPTMIGAIFRDVLYFKTNDDSARAFDAEGCAAFTFMKGKELITTTWRAIPDRLYDDPDELAQWARAALAVAQAAPTAKKKARRAASTKIVRPRKAR